MFLHFFLRDFFGFIGRLREKRTTIETSRVVYNTSSSNRELTDTRGRRKHLDVYRITIESA